MRHGSARWLAAITMLVLVMPPIARVGARPRGAAPTVSAGWGRIVRRGVLRVIVQDQAPAFLPRGSGAWIQSDEDLARAFARRFHLKVELVPVLDFADLIPALVSGKGDVIAADLTVTPERQKRVTFTTAVATVTEVLVGKKGAKNPTSPEQLAGREVDVRATSSFAGTLRGLQSVAPGLKIVVAPDNENPEALAWDVSQGKRPLTVVDSNVLAGIETYNTGIVRCFDLVRGRQIAWAVRKENRVLLGKLDAFLMEHALNAHEQEESTVDLPAMKKRGSLRVLTRNNGLTYFLHRGQAYGFDYELAKMAAQAAGLRLEMIVVPSRADLIPWLLQGRGDVIAASLTDTPAREKRVAFSRPYLYVDQVLVERRRGPQAKRFTDLRGKTVAIRESSSYWQRLEPLQKKYGFELVPVSEDRETPEIIGDVAKGDYDFTVSDSDILDVELTWRNDVQKAFTLPLPPNVEPAGRDGQQAIAFAVRKDNPRLKRFLDRFVARTYRGMRYNMARNRYFKNKHTIVVGHRETVKPGAISPYDAIFKRVSRKYGFDWRLMAAQAYQESRFDPRVKSWVGAKGLFQVMPTTGRAMGFSNLENPEQGAHAGIEYMRRLVSQLDARIPLKHRLRFALAAYNVGLGHVQDARRLAAQIGLNPNKWFKNVAKAMLLLQERRYYSKASHGYCRGSEPVAYVSQIQLRYDNYVKMIPQ